MENIGDFFAGRFCDDEQPAPTEAAFVFDAGLQGEVEVAAVDFIEELFDVDDLAGVDVFEVAVGAGGAERLVLQDFLDDKPFGVPIAVDEDDGSARFQLREGCARQMIMREQAEITDFGRHAKLSNDVILAGDISGVTHRLLDDGEGHDTGNIYAAQGICVSIFNRFDKSWKVGKEVGFTQRKGLAGEEKRAEDDDQQCDRKCILFELRISVVGCHKTLHMGGEHPDLERNKSTIARSGGSSSETWQSWLFAQR